MSVSARVGRERFCNSRFSAPPARQTHSSDKPLSRTFASSFRHRAQIGIELIVGDSMLRWRTARAGTEPGSQTHGPISFALFLRSSSCWICQNSASRARSLPVATAPPTLNRLPRRIPHNNGDTRSRHRIGHMLTDSARSGEASAPGRAFRALPFSVPNVLLICSATERVMLPATISVMASGVYHFS